MVQQRQNWKNRQSGRGGRGGRGRFGRGGRGRGGRDGGRFQGGRGDGGNRRSTIQQLAAAISETNRSVANLVAGLADDGSRGGVPRQIQENATTVSEVTGLTGARAGGAGMGGRNEQALRRRGDRPGGN